jgi:DHA2 family multidrug resistance protein
MMPVVGMLMMRIEPRKILVTGLVLVATSLFLVSRLTLDAGPHDFFLPLFLQGMAMGMIFIPLTTITNDQVPKERMGNATSLFNLMRNLGGSFGIAIVTTILARHAQAHTSQLVAHVDPYDPATAQRMAQAKRLLLAGGMDPWTAGRSTLDLAWGEVQRQAAFLSYRDAFRFLAVLFLSMVALVPLMKRPSHHGPGAVH